MLNSTISKSRFELLCQPLLTLLDKAVLTHNADKGFRQFKAKTHLLLTIYAHLFQVESSRALIENLNDPEVEAGQPSLRQLVAFEGSDYWGTPFSLNQSNFSRANQHRSWRLWRYLAHQLLKRLRPKLSTRQLAGLTALPLEQLIVVDGSLFEALANMQWATYRSTANKIRLHFFYALDGTPDKLVLTPGKGSERAVLAEHLRAGFTYIFDRGYNDYELYRAITAIGAHLVTRLLKNAVFEVVEEHPVSPHLQQLGIVSDQTILLGQEHHSFKARCVVYRDLAGKEYRYLSSRFDLSALTLVYLYLYRWEVETFIGWFKQHLVFEHWYSQCENGVLIQIFAGFITFLLLKYYQVTGCRAEFGALRVENLRWLRRHLLGAAKAVEVEAYALFDLNHATAPPFNK